MGVIGIGAKKAVEDAGQGEAGSGEAGAGGAFGSMSGFLAALGCTGREANEPAVSAAAPLASERPPDAVDDGEGGSGA